MPKFSGTKGRPLRANPTAPIRTARQRTFTHEGGGAFVRDLESELFLLAATNMAVVRGDRSTDVVSFDTVGADNGSQRDDGLAISVASLRPAPGSRHFLQRDAGDRRRNDESGDEGISHPGEELARIVQHEVDSGDSGRRERFWIGDVFRRDGGAALAHERGERGKAFRVADQVDQGIDPVRVRSSNRVQQRDRGVIGIVGRW
jgi:hypothetical protein